MALTGSEFFNSSLFSVAISAQPQLTPVTFISSNEFTFVAPNATIGPVYLYLLLNGANFTTQSLSFYYARALLLASSVVSLQA